jgi:hypothetical protein
MDIESLEQDVLEGKVTIGRVIELAKMLNGKLEEAQQRIEKLEEQLGGQTPKLDEPFSVASEEERQEA